MQDDRAQPSIAIAGRISDVAAGEWDSCAGTSNPFVGHAFLSALEDSGSATPETGWTARHLLLRDGSGRLAACAPLYVKTHSYGEFVFDWSWAEAWQRAGGHYYPKLLSAVPFTPVTGPRLLIRPDADPGLADVLVRGMVDLAGRAGMSSVHVNFLPETQTAPFIAQGFLPRTDLQYHWDNHGYGAFDDFLAVLSSRKRKTLRKERQAVAEAGLSLRTLHGPEITEAQWDGFHRVYLASSDRKWGPTYLSRDFFSLLGRRLGDQVVLMLAEDGGEIVAGALNLRGADCLYGRNWGCGPRFPLLHFELCYYQAIDYAIAHGLARVEAGAQGRHKIQRGYLPATTHSVHWIADPGFRRAVARYLEQERAATEDERLELAAASPYRQDG